MYKCEKCRVQSKEEEALQKIFKKRKKTYSDGSVGTEIVAEMKVCSRCADYFKELS